MNPSSLFPYNPAQPQLMHIDLNSCFAMIEQQANPFLRHRPVAITNRLTPGATVIAASYEAKAKGIDVGTRANEAKLLEPSVVVLETDPPKYIYAHRVFSEIIGSYSNDVAMKSVDEGIINFSHSRQLHPQPLTEVAAQIKQRFKDTLGEYVTCNIGIAPNRFLAKLAAGLHKPDGLDVIAAHNLEATYRQLPLLKLPGINRRFKARLAAYGITNCLEFLAAPESLLRRQVFKSINGHLWFMRLRGWEVDDYPTAIRSIGKQYVLHQPTASTQQLEVILTKMCEMLGRRLRGKGLSAGGLWVGCYLKDHSSWATRQKFKTRLYSTQSLFGAARHLLAQRPAEAVVQTLSITSYALEPAKSLQVSLFEATEPAHSRLADIIDHVNDRYGEFCVMPASMANTQHLVPDKIPFGSTRYFHKSSLAA